jgi:amino acid transporter
MVQLWVRSTLLVRVSILQDLGIYGAVIFLVALLNSCGLQVLTLCTQAGGMFHLAGVLLLVLIVPLMAKEHQPASWVFGHFETAQAESVGITNYFNIAILGLLLPAYSYTGMDGPCHMAEEVEGASMHPPKAILHGWAVMFIGGELRQPPAAASDAVQTGT